MGTKPEGNDRIAVVERLCRQNRRLLRDLIERIEWFLDPPKERDQAAETKPAAKNVTGAPKPDHVPFSRLKELRPAAWTQGKKAKKAGEPRAANPYRDTRGGFRNAWFGGWDETKR